MDGHFFSIHFIVVVLLAKLLGKYCPYSNTTLPVLKLPLFCNLLCHESIMCSDPSAVIAENICEELWSVLVCMCYPL